jgi:hypothetical protein
MIQAPELLGVLDGATTISKATLGITTFSFMTLNITMLLGMTTIWRTTLRIYSLSITILSIEKFYITRHNITTLSILSMHTFGKMTLST